MENPNALICLTEYKWEFSHLWSQECKGRHNKKKVCPQASLFPEVRVRRCVIIGQHFMDHEHTFQRYSVSSIYRFLLWIIFSDNQFFQVFTRTSAITEIAGRSWKPNQGLYNCLLFLRFYGKWLLPEQSVHHKSSTGRLEEWATVWKSLHEWTTFFIPQRGSTIFLLLLIFVQEKEREREKTFIIFTKK